MAAISCPVCDAASAQFAIRCGQCGADFSDPDVRAMMSADATQLPALDLEAGALSSDKFLGVSGARLADGTALRPLAIIGGALGLVTFLWPMAPGFGDTKVMWALDGISPVAVYLPLLAFVAAAIIYFAKLPTKISAGIMAAIGFGGLLFGLAPLGRMAATGEHYLPLWTAGLALAGAAAVARIHRPTDPIPRFALIGAAIIGLVGLALPITEVGRALPGEFRLMLHPEKLTEVSLASAASTAAGHDMMVRFLGIWLLFGAALLVAAPAVGWAKTGGPWDKLSMVLRPIAWTLVMFTPLFFALQVFNVAGWTGPSFAYYENIYVDFEKFTSTVMMARTRLLVSATVFTLWWSLGAYALYAQFATAKKAAATTDAARASE